MGFELVYVGYSKVPDYLEYREKYPSLLGEKIDLKDVQRPWALEKVMELLPPGQMVLDLGGSRAELAAALSSHARMTIIDPYDGRGSGPKSVDHLREKFPDITFVVGLLTPQSELPLQSCVLSTSVVEHIDPKFHRETVEGIHNVLEVGGYSVHAVDFTCRGYQGFMEKQIAINQSWVDAHCEGSVDVKKVAQDMLDDVETFFLPLDMYIQWKKDKPYEKYPWRNVGTLNTVFRRTA